MGVLNRDQGNMGLVVALGVDHVEDVTESERTVRVVERRELHRGVARRGTHLKTDDVLTATGHDEVAGSGEHAHRDLIGHHARGHEESGVLADDLREACFERVDGRVLAVTIIAHRRVRHRVAHRRRGLGHRVASQVYASGHGERLPVDF